MLEVKVDIKDRVSPALKDVLALIDGEQRREANTAGGRAANEAARKYTREFKDGGGWRGSDYLQGPHRESGQFGKNFAVGWNFRSADNQGATISNNAEFYAFKVSGGTIVPKRVKNLTIPMVPEAAGVRATVYPDKTGNKLFRILGKKALFEKTESGGVRAVYALVKKITQQPWPGALPDDETLSSAFVEGWSAVLAGKLEER